MIISDNRFLTRTDIISGEDRSILLCASNNEKQSGVTKKIMGNVALGTMNKIKDKLQEEDNFHLRELPVTSHQIKVLK